MDGSNDQEKVVKLPWPSCPDCGNLRHTFCPGCGTAGVDFPVADWAESDALGRDPHGTDQASTPPDRAFWLVCPTCDDAFVPTFYRRCAQCGFQFPEGLEVDSEEPYFDFNARVAAVAAVLAAASFVIGLLFWWALR